MIIGRTISDIVLAFRSAILALAVVGLVGGTVAAGAVVWTPPADTVDVSGPEEEPPGITLSPPAAFPADTTAPDTPNPSVPSTPTGDDGPPPSISFMATDGQGSPLRIDSCSGPIEIVYDPSGCAPSGSRHLEPSNMAAFGMAHVIAVVDAPTTGGVDIDVGWVKTADELGESDDVLGEGGPVHDGDKIVAGEKVFLVAQPAGGLAPGLGTRSFGAVMLHELLHALNVGHSTDPADRTRPWGPTPAPTSDRETSPLAAVGGSRPA